MVTSWVAPLSFGVSALTPFLWIPILRRLGVFDIPNERSSHTVPTVRGAGVAPATGVALAAFLFLSSHQDPFISVILITALLAAGLGLVEDVRGLSVRFRIAAQLSLASAMTVVLCSLTGRPLWLVPTLALISAGYINVANFMDGLDGISLLHGLVAGAHFAILGAVTDQSWLVLGGTTLACVFLGFAPWNLVRGRVFLGDVGSYLLGSLVVSLGIAAFLSGSPVILAVAPAAPYLADTFVTFLRRLSRGERVFEAHRTHVYQQLTTCGMSHLASASTVASASLLCSGLSFLARMGDWHAVLSWVGTACVIVTYLSLPRILALGRRRVSLT